MNALGIRPHEFDQSTQGTPAKYSCCIAENEENSPWEPLHVERGFSADASTVTVVAAECLHNVNDHQSISAEGILRMIAGTLATTGNNDIYNFHPEPLVIFGPEHAKTVADGGYSKADVKRFLFEHAWVALGKFSNENIERRFRTNFKELYGDADGDAPVHVFKRPEDLLVAVIGGAGKHSAVVPTFGVNKAITRALKRHDGQHVHTVEELRKR